MNSMLPLSKLTGEWKNIYDGIEKQYTLLPNTKYPKDPKNPDLEGITPLHILVTASAPEHTPEKETREKYLGMLDTSLSYEGVDLNVTTTKSGQTPLITAILEGNYEAVDLLIKKGASLTAHTGKHILELALNRVSKKPKLKQLDPSSEVQTPERLQILTRILDLTDRPTRYKFIVSNYDKLLKEAKELVKPYLESDAKIFKLAQLKLKFIRFVKERVKNNRISAVREVLGFVRNRLGTIPLTNDPFDYKQLEEGSKPLEDEYLTFLNRLEEHLNAVANPGVDGEITFEEFYPVIQDILQFIEQKKRENPSTNQQIKSLPPIQEYFDLYLKQILFLTNDWFEFADLGVSYGISLRRFFETPDAFITEEVKDNKLYSDSLTEKKKLLEEKLTEYREKKQLELAAVKEAERRMREVRRLNAEKKAADEEEARKREELRLAKVKEEADKRAAKNAQTAKAKLEAEEKSKRNAQERAIKEAGAKAAAAAAAKKAAEEAEELRRAQKAIKEAAELRKAREDEAKKAAEEEAAKKLQEKAARNAATKKDLQELNDLLNVRYEVEQGCIEQLTDLREKINKEFSDYDTKAKRPREEDEEFKGVREFERELEEKRKKFFASGRWDCNQDTYNRFLRKYKQEQDDHTALWNRGLQSGLPIYQKLNIKQKCLFFRKHLISLVGDMKEILSTCEEDILTKLEKFLKKDQAALLKELDDIQELQAKAPVAPKPPKPNESLKVLLASINKLLDEIMKRNELDNLDKKMALETSIYEIVSRLRDLHLDNKLSSDPNYQAALPCFHDLLYLQDQILEILRGEKKKDDFKKLPKEEQQLRKKQMMVKTADDFFKSIKGVMFEEPKENKEPKKGEEPKKREEPPPPPPPPPRSLAEIRSELEETENPYKAVELINEAFPRFINNINDKDEEGHTLLMWMVVKKYSRAVKRLLDLGANANLKDAKTGLTALMMSIIVVNPDNIQEYGTLITIKNLIEKSDINLLDNDGYDAYHFAEELGERIIATIEKELFAQNVLNVLYAKRSLAPVRGIRSLGETIFSFFKGGTIKKRKHAGKKSLKRRRSK